MNDEERQPLPLRIAYKFGIEHGFEHEIQEIRDMEIEWDLSYNSSVRKSYVVDLFQKNGIFEDFKKTHWPTGNTPDGEARLRRLARIKTQYEEFLAGQSPEMEDENSDDPSSDQALKFALEAHLRDFLARNLDRIETGLRLYEADDKNGIEFAVDGGRIDLLAIDKKGKYVVIELKLSQGRNKTLGQLLYYMGWVDQNMGNSPCRGFIIANEITDDLSVAVARVPGVSLAKYKMSFAIESVVTA